MTHSPVVLLGAWDPCRYAGIAWIARILESRAKTQELHLFPTALTLQNDTDFQGIYPVDPGYIRQLEIYLSSLPDPCYCYIGWVGEIEIAHVIARWLSALPDCTVIMDPVGKASLQHEEQKDNWLNVCHILAHQVHWLLPNAKEWDALSLADIPLRPMCRVWQTGTLGEQVGDTLRSHGSTLATHRRPRASFDPHGSGCTLGALLVAALLDQVTDPFTTVSLQLDALWQSKNVNEFRLRALAQETVQ